MYIVGNGFCFWLVLIERVSGSCSGHWLVDYAIGIHPLPEKHLPGQEFMWSG